MSAALKSSNKHSHSLYLGAVLTLTLCCLWPVWTLDFPALQDYPQHLFLAHVNATYTNPAYNWQEYYLADLRFGPYAFFYLLVVGLDRLLPVTSAGKLYLSLVILAYSGLAVALGRRGRTEPPPWASLLLFPLIFHQMYFMGFTNFLLSVPLLALAVLDHQRLACGPPTALALFRQAVFILLLWTCHPYTVLVYICLTGANALLPEINAPRCSAAFVPPLATAALFLTWYVAVLPGNQGKMPLLWWPWQETLRYYLLMFTGMRWTAGIHWPTLALWGAALALVLAGAVQSCRERVIFPRRTALVWALVTGGFMTLPFWAGQYSYFNLRLAPISYLFAAILAGYCTISRRAGLCLTALAALLIAQSAIMQAAISQETAAIIPLLQQMPPNATLLPMTFQTASAVLDDHFFPEAHSHDYFYYHLLRGGGASPNLFPSPMLPVRLRPDVNLPKATHDFSWPEHGAHYDYILTRGAPAAFTPFLTRYAPLVSQSGAWLLFKNERGK